MKVINTNTILRQGSKEFKAVEIDGVIYWTKEKEDSYKLRVNYCGQEVVAQSSNKLDGIPVISLDSYVERLAVNHCKNCAVIPNGIIHNSYVVGYNSNPNTYTRKDIEKALYDYNHLSFNEIINRLNQIQVIEVDEFFQVLNIE